MSIDLHNGFNNEYFLIVEFDVHNVGSKDWNVEFEMKNIIENHELYYTYIPTPQHTLNCMYKEKVRILKFMWYQMILNQNLFTNIFT